MVKLVLPHHQKLMGVYQNGAEGSNDNTIKDMDVTTMQKLISDLVQKVIANPKDVSFTTYEYKRLSTGNS